METHGDSRQQSSVVASDNKFQLAVSALVDPAGSTRFVFKRLRFATSSLMETVEQDESQEQHYCKTNRPGDCRLAERVSTPYAQNRVSIQ